MLRAVIFDMDGVLIDSQPIHFRAERETAARFGCNITEEELKQYLGWRGKEFWGHLIKKYSLDATVKQMQETNRPVVEKYLREAAKPDGTLRGILADLRKRGMKLSVASSAQKRSMEIILEGLGVRPYFDAVVCGADVERSKPAPDLFMLAAGKMGVEPEECAVVEDAPSGIRAANSAHMLSVALKGPINEGLDLSEADVVIGSLGELPGIVEKNSDG